MLIFETQTQSRNETLMIISKIEANLFYIGLKTPKDVHHTSNLKIKSFCGVLYEKEEEVAALGSALLGWQIMGCLQSCPRRTCVHVPDQHKASDHDDISVADARGQS